MEYYLYVRKSQGAEDRRVLSIEAQISEMKEFASKNNLHVTKIFKEACSARSPGRPVFNTMLKELKKGEAKGILSWKIDRLSRNPIDDGIIS